MKVIIQKDSITPYLNDIENRLHASKKEIIYKIGTKFEEEASANAPDWTGNLSQSADNPELWTLFNEGDFMRLDIVFTGLTGDVEEWWYEFEDERFPEGGRDYALFQETGVDWYAKSEDAKSKWYVRKSAEPTQEYANKYLDEEIRRIMRIQ